MGNLAQTAAPVDAPAERLPTGMKELDRVLGGGLVPGALLRNVTMKYICKFLYLRMETTDTPYTNLLKKGQLLHVPIGHGEGISRGVSADAASPQSIDFSSAKHHP